MSDKKKCSICLGSGLNIVGKPSCRWCNGTGGAGDTPIRERYYNYSCPNGIHEFALLDNVEVCIYCYAHDKQPAIKSKPQPNKELKQHFYDLPTDNPYMIKLANLLERNSKKLPKYGKYDRRDLVADFAVEVEKLVQERTSVEGEKNTPSKKPVFRYKGCSKCGQTVYAHEDFTVTPSRITHRKCPKPTFYNIANEEGLHPEFIKGYNQAAEAARLMLQEIKEKSE